MTKRVLAMGGLGAMGLGLAGLAGGQTVAAVPALDLNRYTGTWYEVARYPNKAEKHCVSDAVMLYALADKAKKFQVVSSCATKDGYRNVRNGNGKRADKSEDGRLKVSYSWPFSSKYWVLAIDPEYSEWALVGNPNRKTLWVLSRTGAMRPEVLAEVEAKASAEGFDAAKLVRVTQGR